MAKPTRKDGGKNRIAGIWIALMMVFITEMLFYTWCRVQCTRVGYDISTETKKRQQLVAIQSNLKIELARLKSPDRITKIARERLGLIMPKSEQTITLP